MTRDIRRYTARWVLPVTAAPIRDGAILIDDDGRIRQVGRAVDLAGPPGTITLDLGEAALLPGLVNAHAHLDLSHLRGRIEDRSFPDWIADLLSIHRRFSLSADAKLEVARWSCIEAVAAGITTIATTEDGDAGFRALIESGLRGIAYREVFGPDPKQAERAIAEVRIALDVMRERETDLVRAGLSPHAPFSVSDSLYRAAAALAYAESLPLATHIAESEAESKLVTAGEGTFAARLQARGIATPVRARSPIDLLHETGILELRPLLIHCVRADDEDIARIAAAGAPVVHCPVANARLGHGIAPIQRMLGANITIGIGTDSAASNNRMDVLEEARFAQMLQRAAHGDARLLPNARLLRMVTLDGARALGLDHRVGSLEAGKDADLCAVSLAEPHARPVDDVPAALFQAARSSDVRLTVVRGRILYRDRTWFTLDADATGRAMDEIGARIMQN